MSEFSKTEINATELNIQQAIANQMPNMPCVLQKTLSTLGELHPNAAKSCQMGILLAKTFQMFSIKRCCFRELSHTNPKLLNWYQINLMPSGKGKDKISDDLDDYFFIAAKTYSDKLILEYKNNVVQKIESQAAKKYPDGLQADQKQDYINKEIDKIRNIVMELSNATPEGLYADAEAISESKYGSLFVKYPEFGLLLQNSRQGDLLTLNALFEAYDSKIHSKSTKHDKRKTIIDNVPVNMLAHSDPTIFKTDVKDIFNILLQTGLARRASITFQGDNNNTIEQNPEKALKIKENAHEEAKKINNDFLAIFENVPSNAVYELTKDTYKSTFYPYVVKITDLGSKNIDNEMIRKEIESRQLKVLKLSGLFACLNHPQELIINETDMQQAISVVELLSKDLPKFLAYRPKTSDSYEKLYNLFYINSGKSFTKTQLVNRYREFGFKRDYFRKRFDEIIEIVKEIALDKGYCLLMGNINNNSGIEVKLITVDDAMPAEVLPINSIINTNNVNAVNPVNTS